MRKIIFLVLITFLTFNFQPLTFNCAPAQAQDKPLWSDDFTKGARDWEVIAGDWEIKGGKCLIAEPAQAWIVSSKAPDLEQQVLEVKMTVQERLSEDGWSVAGIMMWIDADNYFMLGFTEAPDKKQHYIDFLENLGGKWQAQQEEGTRLKALKEKNMALNWKYNTEYKLRFELDKKGITGTVLNPETDKVISQRRYEFGDAEAIRSGRFGMLVWGQTVSYRESAVWKTLPAVAPAAAAPAAVPATPAEVKKEVKKSEGTPLGEEPAAAAEQKKEDVVKKKFSEKIAIFVEPDLGADRSAAESLKSALDQAGLKSRLISGDELCDGDFFNRGNFDVVIFPAAKTYPAAGAANIEKFLAKGGNLIAAGGIPFSNPAWKKDNRWMDKETFMRRLAEIKTENMVFDFEDGDVSGWQRGANDMNSPSAFEVQDGGFKGSRNSLFIDIENLSGWDTWRKDFSVPQGHNLFCFWAKGDDRTGMVSIECVEDDSSRWIASVRISDKWEKYAIYPEEFKYWKDNQSKGRGGPKDTVKFENVNAISVGLSFTHTAAVGPGRHRLWMDEIGTTQNTLGKLDQHKEMVIDGLCPAYKMFPMTNYASAKVDAGQLFVKDAAIPRVKDPFSSSPRPKGTGFGKKRRMRFIPLVNAYDKNGKRCGYLAWMFVNNFSPLKGSALACLGITQQELLKDKAFAGMIIDLAKKMTDGVYLYEGGSQLPVYYQGESVKLGAQVVNFGQSESQELIARIKVKPRGKEEIAFQKELPVVIADKSISVDCAWEPGKFADRLYDVTTELVRKGQVIDMARQELQVWEPKPLEKRNYMTVKDGDFYLNGKKWYAHGVNYMCSTEIAIEDGEYFEQYLSARSYDPDIAEEDLDRMKEMGMNMVSIFIYHPAHKARNTQDLMMRSEKHGIMVNLSLRPNADPLMFKWKEVKGMIEDMRAAEFDVLFAYDLAWERTWGTYESSYGNAKGRKGYDKEWEKWIIERYGSIENAEKDWEFPIPKKGKAITGPSDHQVREEGEWLKMVSAYRRFVDDFVSKKCTIATRLIKSIDPYHFVSFRMAHSGDPTVAPEAYGYDFRAFRSFELVEPEGYGRIGDWNRVRDGAFTTTYARYTAPGRAVMWAEFGNTSWSGTNFGLAPNVEAGKGKLYDDFYKMIVISYANGSSCWWFPGGFRFGENSDFGIIGPDGSWRPTTEMISKYAPQITTPRPMPEVAKWFVVDRDLTVRGIAGVYEKIKDEYWRLLDAGKLPGLKDEATGTNSLNTPLKAVGNVEYNGTNPPKYLNAEFNYVRIKVGVEPSLPANVLVEGGSWIEVEDGAQIEVAAGAPVQCVASAGNLQSAAWIAPANAKGAKGAVYLSTPKESEIQAKAGIAKDAPYFADADVPEFLLSKGISKETKVVLQMTALDRAWFGEKIEFTLVPK